MCNWKGRECFLTLTWGMSFISYTPHLGNSRSRIANRHARAVLIGVWVETPATGQNDKCVQLFLWANYFIITNRVFWVEALGMIFFLKPSSWMLSEQMLRELWNTRNVCWSKLLWRACASNHSGMFNLGIRLLQVILMSQIEVLTRCCGLGYYKTWKR